MPSVTSQKAAKGKERLLSWHGQSVVCQRKNKGVHWGFAVICREHGRRLRLRLKTEAPKPELSRKRNEEVATGGDGVQEGTEGAQQQGSATDSRQVTTSSCSSRLVCELSSLPTETGSIWVCTRLSGCWRCSPGMIPLPSLPEGRAAAVAEASRRRKEKWIHDSNADEAERPNRV